MSPRADAVRSRERILEVARRHDARSLRLNDIARDAGVGIGTVYRHFPTKEALLEALVAEKYRVLVENARAALDIEDPWESFAEALRRNAEVMAADAGLRDALVRLAPYTLHTSEARQELDELGCRLVERSQAAGVLRADVTVHDISALMGGLCMSMGHPELDWRRHLDLLLDGLRARG